MPTRTLLPYEQNFLIKHGFSPARVAAGEFGDMPVEYIVGRAEFLDLELLVDQNVLIPRLETEELVKLVSDKIAALKKENHTPLQIAEIGTGSGAISVYLAKNWRNANFLAADISTQALQIARANAEKHQLSNLEFLQSDLLANFSPDTKIDILIANLPYIPSDRIKNLDSSVKDFEPLLALDGGADGFNLIRQLLTQIINRATISAQVKKDLLPQFIFLEIDDTHTGDFFAPYSTYYSWQLLNDYQQKNRFAIGNRL